jgi:hypothetical protein
MVQQRTLPTAHHIYVTVVTVPEIRKIIILHTISIFKVEEASSMFL